MLDEKIVQFQEQNEEMIKKKVYENTLNALKWNSEKEKIFSPDRKSYGDRSTNSGSVVKYMESNNKNRTPVKNDSYYYNDYSTADRVQRDYEHALPSSYRHDHKLFTSTEEMYKVPADRGIDKNPLDMNRNSINTFGQISPARRQGNFAQPNNQVYRSDGYANGLYQRQETDHY